MDQGSDQRILIAGAGISGLYAAILLHGSGKQVTVVEARDRIGGRACSVPVAQSDNASVGLNPGVDLGPAWLWPDYQPRARALLEELGIAVLEQQETGRFLYQDQSGSVRGIDYPKRYADSVRLRGGMQILAQRLFSQMSDLDLRLNTEVAAVSIDERRVELRAASGEVLRGRALVVAVPPPIASLWEFTPALEAPLLDAMRRWPTWMAGQAKFVAVYDRVFWREAGCSGSAVSHLGPMLEINDHSDPESGLSALFGFLGVSVEQRRRTTDETLAASCIEQLVALFGGDAARPRKQWLMDWAAEPFTTTDFDLNRGSGHPPYAEPALRRSYCGGRLLFAGAEAAAEHGGLVEGALLAAETAVEQLLGGGSQPRDGEGVSRAQNR
ncbi:MAG: NAD(P)/FAD-dependent oxidoreductase [Pseudomonadota bacterium]